MNNIYTFGRSRNLKINAKSLQSSIRIGQTRRHRIRNRTFARITETVHININQFPQLGNQMLNMNTRPAINRRWPLPSQNRCTHVYEPIAIQRQNASLSHAVVPTCVFRAAIRVIVGKAKGDKRQTMSLGWGCA